MGEGNDCQRNNRTGSGAVNGPVTSVGHTRRVADWIFSHRALLSLPSSPSTFLLDYAPPKQSISDTFYASDGILSESAGASVYQSISASGVQFPLNVRQWNL